MIPQNLVSHTVTIEPANTLFETVIFAGARFSWKSLFMGFNGKITSP